jgi:mannose-6-phosphate isomerase-like protein (cupin superfamily)
MARAGEVIENPVTGERITFLETAAATGGERLVLGYSLAPGGFVPAAHVHPRQDERFEILAGRGTFSVAGERRTAGPGETVLVPAGTPHRLWNDASEDLRMRIEFRPALGTERLFEDLFALARAGRLGKLGFPRDPFLGAVVAQKHFEEAHLAGVPVGLQRAVVRLLAAAGRLLRRGQEVR